MIILYRDQQRSGNVFMEKIYRGYPLEVKKSYGIFNPERTCSSEGPKKVPWMLYRREEQSGKTELTGNESRSEIDYLRGLYPASAKQNQILAELLRALERAFASAACDAPRLRKSIQTPLCCSVPNTLTVSYQWIVRGVLYAGPPSVFKCQSALGTKF